MISVSEIFQIAMLLQKCQLVSMHGVDSRKIVNNILQIFFFVRGDLYEQKTTDLPAVEKSMQESEKFMINNILFETGKATLMADMEKNPSARFEVRGHCDNQVSDKINDPLSQGRVEAIVNALIDLCVDE